LAGLGCYSGRGAGLPRWADAGLRGQVSLLLPFLLFLISFFSVFYIVNLSVVLNSNILQTLLVEFKLDTLQVLKK
jgi:hypothetical protein